MKGEILRGNLKEGEGGGKLNVRKYPRKPPKQGRTFSPHRSVRGAQRKRPQAPGVTFWKRRNHRDGKAVSGGGGRCPQ